MIDGIIVSLIVLGWIVCGVLAYKLLKSFHRKQFSSLKWTKNDRRVGLFFSSVGPIGLLVIFISTIVCGGDDEEEASW